METDWFAVPIALVAEQWLCDEFLPAVERCLTVEHSIIWMPIDSSEEASFLLNRIRAQAVELERATTDFSFTHPDPLAFWSDLVGTPERRGTITELPTKAIAFFHNSLTLPSWFFVEQLPMLRALASFTAAKIVIPVARKTWISIQEIVRQDVVIEIPSFADGPQLRKREFVDQVVIKQCPELRDDHSTDRAVVRTRVTRHLLNASPCSRHEIEKWIEHYRSLVEREEFDNILSALDHDPPPPLNLPSFQVNGVLRRQDLQTRFQGTLVKLAAIRESFSSAVNRELFRNFFEPLDPFASVEPRHWFESLVSYLSCLLFDAGNCGLYVLADFAFDSQRADVSGSLTTGFSRILRVLRTTLQHGLDLDRPDDVKHVETARKWYKENCDAYSPTLAHWRILVQRFIELWERQVSDLELLVNKLPQCPSKSAVFASLDKAAKRPPRVNIAQAFRRVTERSAPELDPDDMTNRYFDECMKHVANSCTVPDAWDQVLTAFAEEVVAKHKARCPITAPWLMENGVKEGPDVGKILAAAQKEWNACRGVSGREFLEHYAVKLKMHAEKKQI